MSLFLRYEDMWDRALGGTTDEKQIPHWFANFAYVLIGFVFKVLFRYRVDGRENLRAFKDRCGAVVVSNHTSFLDVVLMYVAARPSQFVRLMGRDSLFGNAHGLAGQILSRVGAFPIKRDSADRTAIKRAAHMLKGNQLVGILPEGTRRGKGSKTPEIHSGAAFIAKMGKAPILPMCVREAENVKRKGERMHFPKITISTFCRRKIAWTGARGTPCARCSRCISACRVSRWIWSRCSLMAATSRRCSPPIPFPSTLPSRPSS